MDPRKANGGVFLGLNGIVIKSHGGADAEGFAAAIDIGYDMVRHELLAKIGETHRRAICAATGKRARWRAERPRERVAFGRARLRQLSAGRVLTNDELAQSVDTSDEWIVQRTGIRERHIAADGELTSDLALKAARAALADAGMSRPSRSI